MASWKFDPFYFKMCRSWRYIYIYIYIFLDGNSRVLLYIVFWWWINKSIRTGWSLLKKRLVESVIYSSLLGESTDEFWFLESVWFRFGQNILLLMNPTRMVKQCLSWVLFYFILFFYVSKVFFSNGNGEVGYNGLTETNSNKLNDTF